MITLYFKFLLCLDVINNGMICVARKISQNKTSRLSFLFAWMKHYKSSYILSVNDFTF